MQIHVAVILLKTSPIAIGQEFYKDLGKAISRAEDSNLAIKSGTDSLAMQEKQNATVQQKLCQKQELFKCSYCHPDGLHP